MRNIWNIAGRVKNKVARYGGNISEPAMDRMIKDAAEKYEKALCLDIGAGIIKDDNFTSNDIRDDFGVDIMGDIRSLFVSDYAKNLEAYPDLDTIKPNHYMVIRLNHIVEHIEWIYQEVFLDWVFKMLAPGGFVCIATPNLEFVAKVYLDQLKRQRVGKKVIYPHNEHSYCQEGVPSHMQKWVNFKIFSGCSPGDYHFCMYDRRFLHDVLIQMGFRDLKFFDGPILRVIAYKPKQQNMSVDEAVRRATG